MTKLDGWKQMWAVFMLCGLATVAASAQIFTPLADFYGSASGFYPQDSLVQGPDGSFYGTTTGDGVNNYGTIFKITPEGVLTTLHQFSNLDGNKPYAGLVLATDGNLYGTTFAGGLGYGTVFKITPEGTFTRLYRFCKQHHCSDGASPSHGLMQGTDGYFYGTTRDSGRTCTPGGCGTIFKITSEGKLTVLHTFDYRHGAYASGLIQAIDGNFYGTGAAGGIYGAGTVFRISRSGKFTTLHNFNGADGDSPGGGLIQASDGSLYGTSRTGGSNNCGTYNCGTIFRITSGGVLTTLHNFNGTDGYFTEAGLVQGTDGSFYGTAPAARGNHCGGRPGCGTVFKITAEGTLTTLYDFNGPDGAEPEAALFQGTDGKFYGTTYAGGNDLGCGRFGCGTVFALDMGLIPFVAFVRDSGRVGGIGGILGQGFTGTTGVSLDGTPAKFEVLSDTFMKAQIPNGATTGVVTVTAPTGTLVSNKIFRVTPQLLSFDPPSGPVGTQVTITGVSLTQTQGIGFGNHTPAQFTVNSDTQVTATVPAGAKTGKIGIETKGGTAISAGTFTVTP